MCAYACVWQYKWWQYKWFKLYRISTEPTGPPQNISFATRNASSITLSWDPPLFEHQNGRIRSYSVIVTHANSGSQWQVTTNSSDTNYTIGGLQPFMNYTFSLAAETVALGPYSLTVTIGTVEGGMYTQTRARAYAVLFS